MMPDMTQPADEVTLSLLDAIHDDARVSQRTLAARLNIALGLTNVYMRHCVHRGWVKVQQVPRKRFAYYLTKEGMNEKGRLVARFLYNSFRLYRSARDQYDALLEDAAERGYRRLVLAGGGDLAEVAMLCALCHDVEVVGVVDPAARANRFRHAMLANELDSLPQADAVLMTEMREPQAVYTRMVERVGAERVLVPPLLRITAVQRETLP